MSEKVKSEVVAQLEARKRKLFDFEAQNFVGPGQGVIGKVKVRVATKAEQDRAIVSAHQYVARLTKGTEQAATDNDILMDAKTVHILHTVVRDADSPDAITAFPSPQWMMEHLSRDEISVLLNHYNYVAAQCTPLQVDISEERVDAIAEFCAQHAGDDLSTIRLLTCDREYLTELVVALSVKLKNLEAANDINASKDLEAS